MLPSKNLSWPHFSWATLYIHAIEKYSIKSVKIAGKHITIGTQIKIYTYNKN